MSEKDLQLLIDLAEAKLKKGVTKEDALQSFIAAGILDASGDYTAPYQELDAANSWSWNSSRSSPAVNYIVRLNPI